MLWFTRGPLTGCLAQAATDESTFREAQGVFAGSCTFIPERNLAFRLPLVERRVRADGLRGEVDNLVRGKPNARPDQ